MLTRNTSFLAKAVTIERDQKNDKKDMRNERRKDLMKKRKSAEAER